MCILARGFNLLDQLLKSLCQIPWWLRMRPPLADSLHAVRVMLAALCCMITTEVQLLLQILLCDNSEEISPGGFKICAPWAICPGWQLLEISCVFSHRAALVPKQMSTPTQVENIFQPHLPVHYLFTVVPPYPRFQLLAVLVSWGHPLNSRNKQFISCKLHAVLSSVMKSHAVPLCPAWDVNHPFVQHI